MRMFPRNFAPLAIGILFVFFTTFASGATRLPADEVEALKVIGKTLGKTDWDFSTDPCTFFTNNTQNIDGFEDSVTCTPCNDTVCHITRIALKAQDLSGMLPPELTRLTYLEDIDLTRNYINGTIPPEWGSMMKLEKIKLLGNRLTGPIPKELANINTLTTINLEFNQLSGSIPLELGSLPLLEILRLTSNYFTGKLPEELANLTTLKDFRIGDNHFTGKMPNFIQNWVNLNKLVIQGSGLDGPIPLGIGLLTNLSDLRISDLNGSQASFPPLNNLTSLKTLILRSCNIIGPLPQYLGTMTNLKILLDLSFNYLSGDIPSTFASLSSIYNMYLTGNLLSGPVPHWMLETSNYIDLSYNNFSFGTSQDCQQRNKNLFGSSSKGNLSGNVSCLSLRSFRCERNWSSFYINCGGKEVSLGGNMTYESDGDPARPSKFYQSKTNWAFSSTGNFLDNDHNRDSVKSSLLPTISVKETPLYVDARISPISLTYYGFCLVNGSYTVNLHFAEIMFNDGSAYSSLGRRIFDIYIQGKLEQKDFNIADEAGGIGQAIIKNYTAVVTHGTLEIRLYWAGKGTTGIPTRGVYGPLISAISVNKLDYVPPPKHTKRISAGIVVGIVAAVAFAIILLLSTFWWRGFLNRKDNMEQDLKGLDLQTGSFALRQIKAATNNFDDANKIGEGGFGSVYKGLLSDGTVIAVKQLSSKSKQGNREFVNEIGMISALQHSHLVKLYGCCIEGNQLLLVYEYMENNSLARALFGPEGCQLQLDWLTRYKICIGIARGLAYLHEEARLKIVHRDIKATNVLLDKNLNAKISDFGLAKLDEEDNTHISTRIAGTYGYMAPEYAMRGYLTDKADVYSFGIVALEIVSGRSITGYIAQEDCLYLLDWALVLKKKGNLMELVDPRLGSDFNKIEATVMMNVALLCANTSPAVRPAMSLVVSMLEARTVPESLLVPDPDAYYQ
ncbi:probable leucine-rich repeat receptor-like serine/threonine-protein kinase At3g14840 [Rhododendron vialii]|uniref:probable leucine-rich repeat receptor-like serine/threonine-protein kinase At3g14840 n=1 Tax=Rhododendron vialii TaxID=182163 RepID=UPI00265F55B6|nr:probable leucine-rich repeat receptor-like serine/threonine-protein kinase At3g14840 [Rhododendron vialii]